MLKTNSKEVVKGDTFIALKGNTYDGHDYVLEAINNGANKVIVEHGKYDVETILVKDTHEYLNSYLHSLMPNIKMIGITGTNGKTTTAYLIYNALNMLNIKCAYIGTIGFYLDKKIKDLNNTTPESIETFSYILKAYELGYQYVVMEVSSHALKQKRCDYINFDYCFFTNLTEDHLDYHKNMDDYLQSKQHLFKDLCKGINIINNDSDYSQKFKINDYITYGFNKSDYTLNNNDNTIYVNNNKYQTNLIGKHNVYNMSCVVILLKLLKIDEEKIENVIKKLKSPKGRLEEIKYHSNLIFIDYAHTPDAVLKVLETVLKIKHQKIITILGCGGNRDPYKRPIMGKIALEKSDYVIFTSDNPRFENPNKIIKEMIGKSKNNNYEIIVKRKKAIERGIQLLKKNDILLVLGKGHEEYQIIKDKKRYFSDQEIVKKCIRR